MSAIDIEYRLREFHTVFGLYDRDIRPVLHREEHKELMLAFASEDRRQIAHELADDVYIAYGSAFVYEIDLDFAVAEIHRANMSKLNNGRPMIREDGKVLKGPNYRPPNLSGALTRPFR